MKTASKYILTSALIAILTITLFGAYSIKQYQDNEVLDEREKLEICIRTFHELLSHKGTEFKVADRQLLAGTYRVNDNFEVPDKIQKIFGGVATIFMDDVRVSTNVLNVEGKRALGTKLTGPAYDSVFRLGKPYRGAAEILGEPYLTAYDPIKNRHGEVIGALFVGVKESEFLARLKVHKMHLALTLSGMVIVFTMSMIILGRDAKRVEDANKNQIRFQQMLVDTIPTPIFFKDSACRYLGCNKAFEEYVGFNQDELIGKTPHEMWPDELADKYLKQDFALLQSPGLQVYESSVQYADGTVRDVIFNKATFNNSDGSVMGLVGVILDVTERKMAEEEVVFQNILLSTQLEASIDGIIVVDGTGTILSFNSRFVELMGIPAHLMETKEDAEVLKYVTERTINPQEFLAKVNYLYDHRHESCRDEMFLCDGKIMDCYTVPLQGLDGRYYGRLWSFRDITERKISEEATKSAYQQFLDIVEFLPDATFVVDKHKQVIAWNRAIEQMTGVCKQEIMGKGNYAYAIPFYNDNRPLLIDLLDQEQERYRHKYIHLKQEGHTLYTEVFVPSFRNGASKTFWATATPLFDREGNHVGAIESIRDITEYKQSEDEKQRLETQLQQARLMESVIVRLGHDLKTPLTPLFALLPLLKDRVVEPDLQRMVEMCLKSAATIKNLAEKSGLLSSLSSTANRLEFEAVSFVSVVERAFCDCDELISRKRISCRNGINPGLVVQALPTQLLELLVNLISNAVYFSSDCGVIEIFAERSADSITVSVRDEGAGLSSDHLDHIFDAFFKADESRHDLNSFGLGLSISKRIVQNHSGRIWAESPGLGKGTTVKFTIQEKIDKTS